MHGRNVLLVLAAVWCASLWFMQSKVESGGRTDSAPSPDLHEACPPIAVLISGQLSRFVYRDSLVGADNNFDAILGCWPAGATTPERRAVDVYIVLSATAVKVKFPQPEPPPYGLGAFDEKTIVEFYKAMGARHVEYQILSDGDIDERMLGIDELVAKDGAAFVGTSAEKWWAIVDGLDASGKYGRRLRPVGSMLLLRHLAYRHALDSEGRLGALYRYSHFLYLREDHVFLEAALDLNPVMLDFLNGTTPQVPQAQGRANVAVDEYCGFGYHPDKIYFADRAGADVLFAESLERHVRHMSFWLLGAFHAGSDVYPMKPERFLQRLLAASSVNVIKRDFRRTDIRYVKGEDGTALCKCVMRIYYKRPGLTKAFRPCTPLEPPAERHKPGYSTNACLLRDA